MSQTSSTRDVPFMREVSIDNFKGIKHCEIKDMSRLNLLIGKNSCGKSAIMEAMYFTGKEFLGADLPQSIKRRANRGSWSARELWYGYDLMSSEVSVRMKFDTEDSVGMRLQFFEQNKRIKEFLYSGSRNVGGEEFVREYNVAGFSHVAQHRDPSMQTTRNTDIRRYFDRSVFIDPTIKTEVRQIEGSYLNVLKLSEEDSLDLAKRTSGIYETKPNWGFCRIQIFLQILPVDSLFLKETEECSSTTLEMGFITV